MSRDITGKQPIQRGSSMFGPPWAWDRAVLVGGLVAAALWLTCCVSLDQIAPPVQAVVPHAPAPPPVDTAALTRGRQIYLNQCVACHSPEPIDRYTLDEWQEIMPDMIEESRLDEAEASDVNAYVFAARRFFDQTPRPGTTP